MKLHLFPVTCATVETMLSITSLALPYSSLESGRLGIERAAGAQERAAQELQEAAERDKSVIAEFEDVAKVVAVVVIWSAEEKDPSL